MRTCTKLGCRHHFAARRAIPAGLRHPDWPCDIVRAGNAASAGIRVLFDDVSDDEARLSAQEGPFELITS